MDAASPSSPKTALIQVFCKAPEPGSVKTRLIPVLGAADAAVLHQRLARRLLVQAVAVADADVELWCSPDCRHPFFEECRRDYGVRLCQQSGDDLGERMALASRRALRAYRHVLLVGTDCPVLDAPVMTQALQALSSGYDATVVPAEDGGYVLLGLQRHDDMLFRDIAWGTAAVMTETITRLRQLGWRCHSLPPLWDVDRPADYRRLEAEEIAI